MTTASRAAARDTRAAGAAARITSARFVIAGATLVTVLTRLIDLTGASFTGDEASNVSVVSGGIQQYLRAAALDHHPPLWYAFLGAWTALLGPGDLAARSSSVLAGGLFVPVIAAVAWRMFGPVEAAWAAAVATAWPLLAQEQREVRMYAWLALAVAVALFTLLRAGERRRPRDWAIAGLALAGLAAVHHFGALAAFALAVAALFVWRGSGPLMATSVAAVAYLPVLLVVAQTSTASLPLGHNDLSLGEYVLVLDGVLLGRLHVDRALVVMGAIAFLPALVAGGARAARWLPFLVAIVVMNAIAPIVLTRTLIDWQLGPDLLTPLVPFAILLVARFVTSPAAVLARPYAALLLGIAVVATTQVLRSEPYYGTDWRALASSVQLRTSDESAIYVAPDYHVAALRRYYRGPLPISGVPGGNGALIRGGFAGTVPTRDDLGAVVAAGRPVWLILDDPVAELLPERGWREISRLPGVAAYRAGP